VANVAQAMTAGLKTKDVSRFEMRTDAAVPSAAASSTAASPP
jgi:hypothetical protein